MSATAARIPGGPGGLFGGKLTELKQRIFFVLLGLIVFRIGAYIPVPGVNAVALADLFQQTRGSARPCRSPTGHSCRSSDRGHGCRWSSPCPM